MAFAAIAALVGGATATTSLVLAAMAQVGTIMTIVGAVTGNKDMMKIGGVLGLVGGIGGLVSGAVSGAATAAGADAAVASAGAQQTADIAAQTATDAATGSITQGAAVGQDLGILGGGVTPTSGMNNLSAYTAPTAAPAIAPTPGIQGAAEQINVADKFSERVASSQNVQAPSAPGAPEGSTKGGGFFSNTMDFIKNPANKEFVNGGMKMLGGAFEGMNQSDQANQRIQFEKDKFNYEVGRNSNVNQQNTSRSGILAGG